MSIITAHKILITTAIIFFAFYAVWEIRTYPQPGGTGALFRSILSALAACGLGVYLRYFLRSLKKPTVREKGGRLQASGSR